MMCSSSRVSCTEDPEFVHVLSCISQMFPPGASASTPAVLSGICELLGGQQSALVLVRLDPKQRSLIVVDNVLANMLPNSAVRFGEKVKDIDAWDADPIAHRLRNRCAKRPDKHFSYSTERWLERMNHPDSFAANFMQLIDVAHDVTSCLPLGKGMFSLLTVFRADPESARFNRYERRLMARLHAMLAPRLIELRDRRQRDTLPESLRGTFSLMLAGHSEKEIAKMLGRSAHTIHDHARRIYRNFKVTSRAQLLARFVDPNGQR